MVLLIFINISKDLSVVCVFIYKVKKNNALYLYFLI